MRTANILRMATPSFSYKLNDFIFQVPNWNKCGAGDHVKNSCLTKPRDSLSDFDRFLQTKWEKAESNGYFRYTLDHMETRVLPGHFDFVAQLNLKRAIERRKPQMFQSPNQPFDPHVFNFTKVKQEEILFSIDKDAFEPKHFVIINVSPLEYCNSLLVPCLNSQLPQKLEATGLQVAIEMLLLSASPTFRIGFNSLCGYASVNHYHFHVFYLNIPLYLETAPVQRVVDGCFELLDYAVPGFVFQLDETDIPKLVADVMNVANLIQKHDIAYNLFMVRGARFNSTNDQLNTVRIYLWPRKHSENDKDKTAFNVACCELSGHLPVKDTEAFRSLMEGDVVKTLRASVTETFYTVRSLVETAAKSN